MSSRSSSGRTDAAASLLLIDDDVELCALMREFFAGHGFDVAAAHDGRVGLAWALAGRYDLLLLDVMMPGLDGFEVLRQLRRQSPVPVIMLTARTEESDRVAGLDAGADDYLPKPFGPQELLARVRAVLRRAGGSPPAPAVALASAGVRLDPAARAASVDGRPVDLTTTEFDLLEILMRSAGRVASRRELAALLFQRDVTPFDRSLDVHVGHLRKKLGRPDLIRTVRGTGYLFAAAGPAP